MTARKLAEEWVHLGLGATAVPQPPFAGMEWYADYADRHAADGSEGRLVSERTFTGDWESWEMHPQGAELVYCMSGAIELVQEFPDGETTAIRLAPGQYAINPPGVWHTANVTGTATALFITAGAGTTHRPR